MQFSILYVFTLAAAAMAATGDMTDFQKRQIRNDVDKPVMTDAQGNVKAFDAADVYLPSKGQRKNKRFYKA
ncbi:hypothetical protein NLU13_8534 [Sarocladium strictum]|uniref:Uncharacterized protein n=1 Tax=Sarocladium strictum TaxID=5046 RepID=A0AA39GD30_SARSR|nr:hypothetical protein NLU13_8534 [Sarocladium strictum]